MSIELSKIDRIPKTHPAKDYTLSLDEGISDIQKQSGSIWTHYNDSDPGVTIFQQLVYGLVDIGYRSSFPIHDLLASKKGKIRIDGQFFRPKEILTTNPVTVSDYRKLILDRFSEFKNVWIEAQDSSFLPRGFYRVLLELRDDLKEEHFALDDQEVPIKDGGSKDFLRSLQDKVAETLNKRRNLCECFLKPVVLKPKPVFLGGSIHLSRDCDARSFIEGLAFQVQCCVFPSVRTRDYEQMRHDGFDNDSIFDGPPMKSGYIDNDDLIERRRRLYLDDIVSRFSKIDGLSYVSSTYLIGSDGEEIESGFASAAYDEVLFFPDPLSAKYGKKYALSLIKNGMPIDLSRLKLGDGGYSDNQEFIKSKAVNRRAHQELEPAEPVGRYRDVQSYSSIQNTFPPIYGVGETDFFKTASEKRKAQAKQLRGFLFFFEQLLGNAFSQIANIHKLFSFRKGVEELSEKSKRGSSKKSKIKRDLWSRQREEFATYFPQTLYGVPGAESLLRGVEKFACPEDAASRDAFADAWNDYQDDPYNEYRIGLERSTQNQNRDLDRKKRFLDHQLARFGESLSQEERLMISPDNSFFEQDEVLRRIRYLNACPKLGAERAKACGLPDRGEEAQRIKQSDEAEGEGGEPKGRSMRVASGFEEKLNCILQVSDFYSDVVESIILRARDENNALADSFDISRVEVWRVEFDADGNVDRNKDGPGLERVPLKESSASSVFGSAEWLADHLDSKKLIVNSDTPYILVFSEAQLVLFYEDDGGACKACAPETTSGAVERIWNIDYVKGQVLQRVRALQELSRGFKGFVFAETTPFLLFENFRMTIRVRSVVNGETLVFQSDFESMDTVYRVTNALEDDKTDFEARLDDSIDANPMPARVRLERRRLIVGYMDESGARCECVLTELKGETLGDDDLDWKDLDGTSGEFKFDLKLETSSETINAISDCDSSFPMGAHLFFPDWVARFAEPSMRDYLVKWANRNLPAHIQSRVSYIGMEDMAKLLSVYADWVGNVERIETIGDDVSSADFRRTNEELFESVNRLSCRKSESAR